VPPGSQLDPAVEAMEGQVSPAVQLRLERERLVVLLVGQSDARRAIIAATGGRRSTGEPFVTRP